MKTLKFLLFFSILFSSCSSLNIFSDNPDIDLGQVKNNYIDLADYPKEITISGKWKGDRIVLRNASNKDITFKNAKFFSTHKEDALIVWGDVNSLRLLGDKWRMNGALTFWGLAENVEIKGLKSRNAHTGIRITLDLPHRSIYVHHNKILHTKHEGIYIGPSKASSQKLSNILVYNNLVSGSFWDAIQLGNANGSVHNNKIVRAARASEKYQDYGVTLNPGGIYYFHENKIIRTKKKWQFLDSRVFSHEKMN